jgi:hypothetical protein
MSLPIKLKTRLSSLLLARPVFLFLLQLRKAIMTIQFSGLPRRYPVKKAVAAIDAFSADPAFADKLHFPHRPFHFPYSPNYIMKSLGNSQLHKNAKIGKI